MLPTLPYVLSPGDSAKAHEIAQQIVEQANRFERMALARYGMNLFQQCPSESGLVLEASNIIAKFPGVGDYIRPFASDAQHLSRFASEVALQVHFYVTRYQKPIHTSEVSK